MNKPVNPPYLNNYTLVVDPQDVGGVLSALDRANTFSLDLETTGLDFKRDDIHGVALATATNEWYVTLGAEKTLLEKLTHLVSQPETSVIGHNISFDMHFLRKCGVDPRNVIDTMVGQFLVDENQKLGLKLLANTRMGIPESLPDFDTLLDKAARLFGKKKADVNILDMPLENVSEYAARDARLTYDLWFNHTIEGLQKEGQYNHFMDVEMPFTVLLTDMEEAGFYINQERLAEADELFQSRKAEELELFLRLTGDINPNSGPQLAKYFYEQLGIQPTRFTDSGGPSTDSLALARMLADDSTGAVRALLRYRKYEKLLSTYIERFKTDVFLGRLFGGFNQTGTVTGRLSSSGPNLQNIPSQGETGHIIKELFGTPEGFTFIDSDYSQLELRILAHYTQDENLLQVFRDNGDPHQMTVDRIKSLGFDITRSYAKRVNFGWSYGVGPKGLADQIEQAQVQDVIDDPEKILKRPSEADTKAWLNGFEKAYPAAAKWRDRVLQFGSELGYVRTLYGRRRRLPDLRSKNRELSGRAGRQAINAIIQAGASDIIKWAMLEIHPLMREYGVKMLAQVHDELCFEAPDEVAKEFGHKASEIMKQAGEHFNLRVDLVAEPGYGKTWAEAKG